MSLHFRRSLLTLATLPVLMLAGCGSSEDKAGRTPGNADPAFSNAVADPIMDDPELTGQNEAATAGILSGMDTILPSENNTAEEIAAAKSEALAMTGNGGGKHALPEAAGRAEGVPALVGLTAAARAAVISSAAQVDYTMMWAARLPDAFPVYPRGNVQEAAGADGNGCALRSVRFTTPVTVADVMDFYHARALAGGYSVTLARRQDGDTLAGVKGQLSYVIRARRTGTGRAEVDLITL